MENIKLILDLLDDPETDVDMLKNAISESYQENEFSDYETEILIESGLLEDYSVKKSDKHDDYSKKDVLDAHLMRIKFTKDLYHTIHHANSPDHIDIAHKKDTVRDNLEYIKNRASAFAKAHALKKDAAVRQELVGKNLANKAAGKIKKHIHNYLSNNYQRKHDLLNASVKGGE